jgi:plastocyanin
MRRILLFILVALSVTVPLAAQTTGTIKGRVLLSGKSPGNAVIRMGVDPKCGEMNRGKRVIQEVITVKDGGLSNAFVKLQGTFPATPVPSKPVILDQRSCIYQPRVIGVRMGQTVEIHNSDPLLHNLHSFSAHNNSFNVGQPVAGLVYKYQPKSEETMLRLKCDVHRWMTAYIGVVSHPYFAVSGEAGTFTIDKVPVGTQTIQVWHERYGILMKKVQVKPGAVTTVDFTYTGNEKPPAGVE